MRVPEQKMCSIAWVQFVSCWKLYLGMVALQLTSYNNHIFPTCFATSWYDGVCVCAVYVKFDVLCAVSDALCLCMWAFIAPNHPQPDSAGRHQLVGTYSISQSVYKPETWWGLFSRDCVCVWTNCVMGCVQQMFVMFNIMLLVDGPYRTCYDDDDDVDGLSTYPHVPDNPHECSTPCVCV